MEIVQINGTQVSLGQITLSALSAQLLVSITKQYCFPSTERMKHKTQSQLSMEEEKKLIGLI
jgi:hypothetical protein